MIQPRSNTRSNGEKVVQNYRTCSFISPHTTHESLKLQKVRWGRYEFAKKSFFSTYKKKKANRRKRRKRKQMYTYVTLTQGSVVLPGPREGDRRTHFV